MFGPLLPLRMTLEFQFSIDDDLSEKFPLYSHIHYVEKVTLNSGNFPNDDFHASVHRLVT